MNKAKLIEQLSKRSKESKATVKRVVEAFVEEVGSRLRKNDSVVMTGFGTFSVMKRKARVGVNPATGKKMQIAAKKVPKFKAGKALKEIVG